MTTARHPDERVRGISKGPEGYESRRRRAEYSGLTMNGPRGFPSWDELYRNDTIESLPWYWPALDPDLESALERYVVRSGTFLDLGTGPGTQAIALAVRGFQVTATDLSPAAIAYATRKAKAVGVDVAFVTDDILATHLTGPYDAVFDRGCFHVIAPEQRALYVKAMHGLLAPSGRLYLKTFSHHQPGTQGPHRFAPDDIRRCFAGDSFEVIEILDAEYQGQLDPWPKALFSVIRLQGS
jgi:SAM-dependent methyltransferase